MSEDKVSLLAFLAGQVAAQKTALLAIMKSSENKESIKAELARLSLMQSFSNEHFKTHPDYARGQQVEADDLHRSICDYVASDERTKRDGA